MDARPNVMISSTARDLPEHRKQVIEACSRRSMLPLPMEYLTADPKDAVAVSLRMVDQADIYIGIFAHRYGYIPDGQEISITEMEYERARQRNLPCYIFFMHKDHAVLAEDVETGFGAEKLKRFKERLEKSHVPNWFKDPHDLRAHVLDSLSQARQAIPAEIHYVSGIPAPPEPYIAHPYTLLQTKALVGRQDELDLLTDWVANPRSEVYASRIFNVVAMGGMGKSSLTWKWFNDIAPQEMQPLAGRIWWSFYESDAHFDNFVLRTLAYVSKRPIQKVQSLSLPEREEELLAVLNREPHLVVLDGLERILIAYARMDAARIDDEELDQQTANFVFDNSSEATPVVEQSSVPALNPRSTGFSLESSFGVSRGTAHAFKQMQLRKTVNPRVGSFLRRLAQVRAARILVSTRLYPADLQTETGEPLPGSFNRFLLGLRDQDALELWRQFGVSGSRDTLLPMFRSFGNYPLLIRVLAGEVARFRRAPGDYDRWCQANPTFDPFKLDIKQVKTHVLSFPLDGLDDVTRQILATIVGFRMPANYESLVQLLVGEGKLLKNEVALDVVLSELEERGLVGWDRRSNRYDLHPVVRGVTWSRLPEEAQLSIFGSLHTHFASFPRLKDEEVQSLDDLTPIVEQYHSMVGLGRLDEACELFEQELEYPTRYKLGACRERVEWLGMLFPTNSNGMPDLTRPDRQAFALRALGESLAMTGESGRAIEILRSAAELYRGHSDHKGWCKALNCLSSALQRTGNYHEAEAVGRQVLIASREHQEDFEEAVALMYLTCRLLDYGSVEEARIACDRAAVLFREQNDPNDAESITARLQLFLGETEAAYESAKRNLEIDQRDGLEYGVILSLHYQGEAARMLGVLTEADELLNSALTRARTGNFTGLEIDLWISLAKLRCQQGNLTAARKMLDEVWELVQRGPYPMDAADAFNTLSEIEEKSGNGPAAIAAATQAYRAAWCDGPPYAYQRGLAEARKRLQSLNAPEPDGLRPFDESRCAPLLPIEINPPRSPRPNLPPGITDTRGWDSEQLVQKLEEVKRKLDWENTTGSAKTWWEAFENENKNRTPLVLRLAEELAVRNATITEFFLAYVYSNTDSIQANLFYLDYKRIKTEVERKKKVPTEKMGAESNSSAANDTTTAEPPTFNISAVPPPGITDTAGWSEEALLEKLAEVKATLDWENTSGSARTWWEAFESENKHRLPLVLRLAEELANRKATITEFFLAYVYSDTDNIQANLFYLDYIRLKKEEEQKKKRALKGEKS